MPDWAKDDLISRCPYGQVGEYLWVRETFSQVAEESFIYRADEENGKHCLEWPWTPSIFMPREASRITLEITDIRVERLQEISTEDIRAEGISTKLLNYDAWVDLNEQWMTGWDKLYAKKGYGWNENPHVWVIEFKKIPQNS